MSSVWWALARYHVAVCHRAGTKCIVFCETSSSFKKGDPRAVWDADDKERRMLRRQFIYRVNLFAA